MDLVPQLETCRICAKCYLSSSSADFMPIFQSEGPQFELDFIRKEIDCWELKISSNDGLPQQICSNCYKKFCTIEAFRQECLTAQNLLHQAKKMTESQAHCNVTPQNTTQAAILLPGTIVLANAQPIPQQFNSTGIQIPQATSNSVPQHEKAVENSEDAVLFNVVGEETAVVNDVASSTNNHYEFDNVACWDETKLFNEVIAQEADTTTQSSTEDFPKKKKDLNDLEEMLEGSIIPKDLKNFLNSDTTLEESPASDLEENKSPDDIIEDNVPLRIAKFPHACNYCYCPAKGSIAHLIFQSSEQLSQHFFDVHDPKLPYPCPQCPKLFSTMSNRDKHYNSLHGNSSKASNFCTYCNKKLNASQEAHEKNCNYTADWHCKICKSDFIKMPLHSFRAHQRSHNESHFRCDICHLAFSQLSLLITHKRHHKPNAPINKRGYICATCNQSFNSSYELKSHEFSTHNGKASFQCKFCAKCYSTLAFLKRHTKTSHSNQNGLIHEEGSTCHKCNITFQSKSKLNYHMQRTKFENGQCVLIKNETVFRCVQCSKRYSCKEQLQVHQESHDVKLRPYGCKKCNVRCRTASDLMEHDKLAHINLAIFKCDKCNENFAYKKDLETHKLYHAKIMFQCTFKDCKKEFRVEKDLERHMQEHERISCEYCGKLFTIYDIEAHIKLAHNNNNNVLDNSNLNNVNDFSFSQNHIFDNYVDPMNIIQEETPALGLNQDTNNVCPPYVEPMTSDLLNENIIFEEQELITDENNTIANNVNFNMSEETLGVNDSFISSLLDPDYEIVVS